MNNQEIIRKADLALSDLATAGKLNPEQTDRFVRTLIDTPTILKQVRTVTMRGPQMKINKIGFGSRILRPAVSSTALAANQRVKPDLGQVVLNTEEVIAEIQLPYDVIEDNIERGNVGVANEAGAGGLHQTIVDLIAERAALDLEELGLQGDTGSADDYLALCNGYLKLATANGVAVGGAFRADRRVELVFDLQDVGVELAIVACRIAHAYLFVGRFRRADGVGEGVDVAVQVVEAHLQG